MNESDNIHDKVRKDIDEASDKATIEKINTYEEEEDDDDTPFVMIRRVNNHSSTNKFSKGKTHNENITGTQGKNQRQKSRDT